MIWKITCYNGTVWKSNISDPIHYAIEKFKKDTGLHEMDIKLIENLS
jgi:hypothetical protein